MVLHMGILHFVTAGKKWTDLGKCAIYSRKEYESFEMFFFVLFILSIDTNVYPNRNMLVIQKIREKMCGGRVV